jgi:hypothetical protein
MKLTCARPKKFSEQKTTRKSKGVKNRYFREHPKIAARFIFGINGEYAYS